MSVTRNTLALLIGSIAQKAIAFVYFALIARWAGVEDTGKYFFALSWSLMFSIVTDIGLTPVLIREIAKKPEDTGKYLSQVMSLKLPLMALAAAAMIVGIWILGYPPITRMMVGLTAIVLALDAVSLTFYGALRGHHALKYESIGLVIGQTTTLIVGLAVLAIHAPLYWLMFALIAGSMINSALSIIVVRSRLGITLKPIWDKPFITYLIRTAIPFALAGAFVKLYTNADVVLLNKLSGDAAAGIYSVPYKLTFAFQFIPMAFTAALYPAMSRDYVRDRARLGELFYKALWYLSLIAAPVIAGIATLSKELVRFVYGSAYAAASVPLALMILSLSFIFLDFPVGSMLNASDRQMTQTKLMGSATLVSIVLNVILIPPLGVMGVVIASIVSHGVLFFGGLRAVDAFLEWPRARLVGMCLRIAAAAAGMAGVVWLVKSHLPLPVSILVGGASYPLLVLLTGSMKTADVKDLLATVLRKKAV